MTIIIHAEIVMLRFISPLAQVQMLQSAAAVVAHIPGITNDFLIKSDVNEAIIRNFYKVEITLSLYVNSYIIHNSGSDFNATV